MTFYSLFTPKGASDKLTCRFLELQSECLDYIWPISVQNCGHYIGAGELMICL